MERPTRSKIFTDDLIIEQVMEIRYLRLQLFSDENLSNVVNSQTRKAESIIRSVKRTI